MKKLFVSLVAMVMATMSYAQSNLVATLSHNGEISVFHGAGSLGQAMDAADHGDIITLAGGRYNAANITKAITLRGAGMEEDVASGTYRTHIVGNFDINIPDSLDKHLTIEGIYHENTIRMCGILSNAMLQKCRFKEITYSFDYNTVSLLTCINCQITNRIYFPRYTSATFINCVVNFPYNSYGGNMEFTNCVITGQIGSINNSAFANCLFRCTYSLNNTNSAVNCVGFSDYYTPFENLAMSTNITLSAEEFSALFKEGTFWELTDEAKAEYVGLDGKEIGIYGGNLPWDVRILSPQITKCNVAAKTTADGKLSVDIEVKAAE